MRHLFAVFLVSLVPAVPAAAQDDWPARKCAAYAAAWDQALELFGSDQLNYGFIAGNENYIAAGCVAAGDICPQSRQELDIANALTLALMNAGTASTFLPFRCPREQTEAGGWSGPGL